MTQTDIDWVKEMISTYTPQMGEVLDIGSLNINGTIKPLFDSAKSYLGIDFQEGENVDLVINNHDIGRKFQKHYFDIVICLNTFEHDSAFWVTLDNINHILKSGGYMFFAIPTIGFPIHDHPGDYWRATEQAVKEIIFQGFEILDTRTYFTKEVDGKGVNPVIQCFGRKI